LRPAPFCRAQDIQLFRKHQYGLLRCIGHAIDVVSREKWPAFFRRRLGRLSSRPFHPRSGKISSMGNAQSILCVGGKFPEQCLIAQSNQQPGITLALEPPDNYRSSSDLFTLHRTAVGQVTNFSA
jgi:hypothetical protein